MNLSYRLRTLRMDRNLTQKEVHMGAGIGIRTLTWLEDEKRTASRVPKLSTLQRLLDFYGVSIGERRELICLWARVRLGNDAEFIRVEPVNSVPAESLADAEVIRRASYLLVSATPKHRTAALKLLGSPQLLNLLAEWMEGLKQADAPRPLQAEPGLPAQQRLISAGELARKLGWRIQDISAMRKAGFPFPPMTLTTYEKALEWLEAHPEFRPRAKPSALRSAEEALVHER